MIFPGRMLGAAGEITVWEHHEHAGYFIHFVGRGLTVALSADELAALGEAISLAQRALAEPEPARDTTRRLQVLQARVADYARRERERRPAAAETEGDDGS